MKNRYLYKLGCMMLAGSMLMSTAPVAYASSLQTELQKEAESNTEGSQTETSQPETSQSETPATETETSQPETKPELETRQTETAAAETETNASQTGDTDASKEDGTSDSDKKDDGSDKKDGDKKSEGDSKDDKNKKDDADDKDSQKGDIQKPDDESEQVDHSDAAADYASNIIAGNSVYLGELSSEYGISFDEEFEKTMDKIEADYKEFLDKPEDFLAENWQDVLAVYVMKYGQDAGIKMDKSCRDDLEQIFFLMNVRSNSAILRKLEKIQKEEVSETEGRSAETEKAAEVEESTETEKAAEAEESTETEKEADAEESTETKKVAEADAKEYRALSVQDYIALYGADEEQTAILEKYTSTKCRQLCAIVTASKGFVRSEAGSDVSEERVSIVAAACSLIGKVGYFWGGKSYAIGWDDSWGSPMTVSAEGSKSSGTVRSYGLDCSGFVAWSYYNGLGGKDAGIGNHTTTQWNASEMVDSQSARPGDLVFYHPASAGDDNHVGIVVGVNDNGSLLVVHCSSSQNGVMTGEAWSAGFQYVRSPLGLE
ncbi:C40 family peptidase [Faecalicatena fissicatena]|uniref:C40 family peptidase n=2 Tax=Faecalicatena fissicatena TaxID=290055 RepID=A0ABX2GU65_9FIRM|nr:NlpC/P60 family protein [Faecalicatena fissicatena]MCB5866173.1 NlpC/P60 family protein [Faecalicatena fissicatena]NSD81616.1 C40 family peptidase [Faecalicatena fissicatena]NSE54174.1 C40 family peptidase [Faecalicatena fissicatena]NSE62884.1 C40 family peptidase [Faecalicatena fissicatena]NSG29116.1 C40 family peptidase [Faecalicatena fissicatena]